MRVIAGIARGRTLAGPPSGAATRPTSDKVREALFNVLGPSVIDAQVLDLFAGTGALGIEALSRGAAHVVFVESDRRLCDTIRRNLATVGLADHATVLQRDVRRVAPLLSRNAPFDLVFVDPPYSKNLEIDALALLAGDEMLASAGTVVVEHASREAPTLPAELAAIFTADRTRIYGDTALTCYRATGASSSDTPQAPGNNMTRVAVYPGSFDPLTNGHYDVIKRSMALFDRLVIAVASNMRKNPLFTVDERIALIRDVVGDDPRIEIDAFDGLLVEYANRKGAIALVRGLRAVADFEYEFEMATMNRRLAPNVETVFLMTHENYFYVSSHLVKEVAMLGGDIDAFVPPVVATRLKARMAERKP